MSFITGIIQSVSYYLPYFSFSHSEVSRFGERFSGRYPASRYQIHSQCLDRRNYFQCFQHLTFSFGLHSRNGGCFSVGRRTCLGPRCVHQLFQHPKRRIRSGCLLSNLDCYRYHLQRNSGRQTTKKREIIIARKGLFFAAIAGILMSFSTVLWLLPWTF